MEQYLHYIGGGAGALALTGVAAASAYYLTSRPTPERPLFPLDAQCIFEQEVSTILQVTKLQLVKNNQFFSVVKVVLKTIATHTQGPLVVSTMC
nr:unnamed protein product [Callosobruchus chinensis]